MTPGIYSWVLEGVYQVYWQLPEAFDASIKIVAPPRRHQSCLQQSQLYYEGCGISTH